MPLVDSRPARSSQESESAVRLRHTTLTSVAAGPPHVANRSAYRSERPNFDATAAFSMTRSHPAVAGPELLHRTLIDGFPMPEHSFHAHLENLLAL